MPFYLIRLSKKRRWDRDAYSWLGPNQAPADVYQEFRVDDGKLSVWHIEDDRSNLGQVITALAVTRQTFDVFDFGLFDQMLVPGSGVRVEVSDGKTPLHSANHWHRDLIELTTDNFGVLAKALFDAMETDRRFASDIRVMIIDAVRGQQMELSEVDEKMRARIQQAL